jgi:hypothetical protein
MRIPNAKFSFNSRTREIVITEGKCIASVFKNVNKVTI